MARATTTASPGTGRGKSAQPRGRSLLKELQAQLQGFRRKPRRQPTDNPYKVRGLRAYLTWGNLPVFLACFLVLFGIGVLLFLAMGIYADIGRNLVVEAEQQVINWHFLGAHQVKDWWLIGWPLALLLRLLAWGLHHLELTAWGLFFVAIFLLLQGAEVAHTLFYNSPLLLHWAIQKFSAHQKYEIPDTDSPIMAKLKEHHNTYYESFFETLETARNIAYLIDFLILMTFAPISLDGRRIWQTFGDISFGLEDVDSFSLFQIAISLCIVHLLVKLYMQISKGFKIFSKTA